MVRMIKPLWLRAGWALLALAILAFLLHRALGGEALWIAGAAAASATFAVAIFAPGTAKHG